MTALIKSALRKRYALLPYWFVATRFIKPFRVKKHFIQINILLSRYTLFYENEKTGAPPMRPLWYDFPEDPTTFPIEDQHLVG